MHNIHTSLCVCMCVCMHTHTRTHTLAPRHPQREGEREPLCERAWVFAGGEGAAVGTEINKSICSAQDNVQARAGAGRLECVGPP